MSEAIENVEKHRRQYRNIHITQILTYRMPAAAIVSILHRISGFLLFLSLPFLLYLFERSLVSEVSFGYFKGIVSNGFVKLVILVLSWAYLHHFCAGIRHLFMDNHFSLDKQGARNSAVTVLAISLPLAAIVAWKLFGA